MVARASYLCCELNWTQQAKIFYNFFYFFVSFGYVVHARYILVYLAVLSTQTMYLFLLLFCVKSHFFHSPFICRCMWPLGEEVEELWCGLPTSQETSGSLRGFLLSEVTVTP